MDEMIGSVIKELQKHTDTKVIQYHIHIRAIETNCHS